MIDKSKLKELALAAEKDGQHIYMNPRDSNQWRANSLWHEAASPEVFLELLAENEELTLTLAQRTAEYEEAHADRLRYATSRLATPAADVPALQALLARIDDAWSNYERMGEACSFEGQPMIYVSTLAEIVELSQAIAASPAPSAKQEPEPQASGMHAAADYIEAKAQKYIDENADTEHDTGATVFHYGVAGREYHSSLVELADELRSAAPIASQATADQPGLQQRINAELGAAFKDDPANACRAHAAVTAALRAAPAGSVDAGGAVPAGFVLVPAEPTERMREAAASYGHPYADKYPNGYSKQRGDDAVHAYRDMLAAAPVPPAAPAEPTDEQLRETDGYKLGWMEGMQEGAELATGGEKTAADVESEFADLLPGSYYMDPPDGGSPSVLEQVRRMAEDAAQWRAQAARSTHDEAIIADLEAMAADKNNGFWPQALALGALRMIRAASVAQEVEQPHTAGAAKGGDGESIHSQEFHELAMDYRGASTFLAPAAYQALLDHITVWSDRRVAAARRDALNCAAEALEALNDSAGDRAAYDNREMYDWETVKMQALKLAADTVRSLSTAADSQGEQK